MSESELPQEFADANAAYESLSKQDLYDYATGVANAKVLTTIEFIEERDSLITLSIKGEKRLIKLLEKEHGFVSFELYQQFIQNQTDMGLEKIALYLSTRKSPKSG